MKKFEPAESVAAITSFMREYFSNAGFTRAVIGLSGGIDSAVAAVLASRALGSENLKALLLPYEKSSKESQLFARKIATQLKIDWELIDISPPVKAYYGKIKESELQPLRLGNFLARIRMCILFDRASENNALVIGTGNKSELMTGYCTQYGDNACSLEPIGHLYKTQIFALAKFLGVPAEIINQNPSADLWEGQTDEEEMGISYKELDEILVLLESGKSEKYIENKGHQKLQIAKVKQMIEKSHFKRKMPATMEDIWL